MLLCYLKSYSNCCIIAFKRIETQEVFTFELSNKYNDFLLLLKFFNKNRNELLIGYNMENFYNIVFNFILFKYNTFLNEKATFIAYYIYNVANNVYSETIDKNWKYPKFYNCIDLLKILTSRDSSVTLTEMEMYMEEEDIDDFKFVYNNAVIEYKIVELKKYCIEKLNFLNSLYEQAKDKINYRFLLSREYNINVLNRYETGIGKIIIEKSIINHDKINKEELFSLKDNEDRSFHLKDVIVSNITFKTKEFNKLLNDLNKIDIISSIDEFKYNFVFNDYKFNLNNGGLEFKQDKTIFATEENENIIRLDISNAYPSLIHKHDIYPEFLPNTFKEVFNFFYQQRIDKSKDKELTKLPLLGVIGNFYSPNSFLYSPKTYMSITLNLKLYILKLVEEFCLNNIEILYIKTDEIIIKIKDKNFAKIVANWMQETGFNVKMQAFEKIIALNINDMILYGKGYKKDKSLIETRGLFNEKSRNFGVNKNTPIIYKCIIEYFGEGVSIYDYLKNQNNINDYLFYYKVNRQFKIITKKNEKENIEENRIGRYFVSKKGNKTYKNNIEKKTSVLLHENNIIINNDSFKKDEIDKSYYYHEIIKLKNIIQPLQQKLF